MLSVQGNFGGIIVSHIKRKKCVFIVFTIIDEGAANKMTSQKKNKNKIKTRKNSFDVVSAYRIYFMTITKNKRKKNFYPHIKYTLYMGIALTISHH